MKYNRNIEEKLQTWSQSPFRKPLVLRGARQVGKTTVVRLFARSFHQFVSLNLETDDAKMFEGERNIHKLVDRIFFEKQALKEETDTLIFIDEIQEVPTALNMLRYFYEEYPQYHVIAAGSLLESLFNQNVSFPVGRVDYLYMYPFSFAEFLEAMGEKAALAAYHTTSNDLNNLYKGRIAEHIIAQELIATSDNYLQPLLFWVREKSGSNAEVDFLLSTPYGMIPIEVKAGATGHLKSLLLYMDAAEASLAVRLYAGEYRKEELVTPQGKPFTLLNIPYCFIGKLQQYIAPHKHGTTFAASGIYRESPL